ncbi:MAG: histidine triad nucleotide-binding protein [Dehalococcoidia bacterium]|nr:histidine triad nucleotide-binding protein [Dehalococcoidia bacterium]
MAQDCIFCKIGAGAIPSTMLYKDETCFVIRDIHPKAPTHLLVIPRRHFTALTGAQATDDGMLGHLLAVASKVAKQEGVADSGYRLVVNQGENSGQEVPHLHVHLLAGRKLAVMG